MSTKPLTPDQKQLDQALEAGQATNIAGTQLTVDELMGQLGEILPELNQAQNYSNLQGSYAEANAGIGQEQLGLQGAGLGAQAALTQEQYGIQGQTLAGQEKLAGIQNTLATQGLQAQIGQQQLGYTNEVQQTQGAAAAAGAANTAGAKQTQATDLANNQFAQGELARQGIGQQASYGYQQQQFGLEQQGQAAQEQYSLGNIARGEAGLNLTAKQNGLSLDQTLNQINYGMTQAGQSAGQQADQLYGQIGSAIGQGESYTAGALGYGALLGGVNLNSALSGGTP